MSSGSIETPAYGKDIAVTEDSFAFVSDQSDLEGAAVGFANMARDLLAQKTMQGTLDRIVDHATQLITGCEHAGILLLHGNQQVETAAATSDLVEQSDSAQAELQEGPCFDAAFDQEIVYRVTDITDEHRWPRYAPIARKLGVGSMMGFRLYDEGGDLGALDLYSSVPDAFDRNSELAGWIFASHAAVAFSAARTSAQLHEALTTRREIGEAMGILSERYSLAEGEAFPLLTKISQDRNIKLRDVARMINEGDFPGDR